MTFQKVLEEIEQYGGVRIKNFNTMFDVRLCMTTLPDLQDKAVLFLSATRNLN
jgi:hypothetical protein